MVDPVAVFERLGGVARWGQLRRRVSRRRLARALAEGRIVRIAHGRYALPLADTARVAASGLTGTVSHTSAALHWGWAVKVPPARPHVTVPRKRHLATKRRVNTQVHWRDLRPDEIDDGWVTSPVRTVIDCCLDLPFDQALAVFDSAWRAGLKPRDVQTAAIRLPKRQRDRVWTVARAADPRAANPFESVLRAIALSVTGLRLEPQHVVRDVGFYARVDLADERLKIVVEAESVEFHTGRKAFDRDCRRYNGLVVRGWLVLRFSWEQVMFEPELVAATLQAVVDRRRRRRTRSTGTTVRSGASTA